MPCGTGDPRWLIRDREIPDARRQMSFKGHDGAARVIPFRNHEDAPNGGDIEHGRNLWQGEHHIFERIGRFVFDNDTVARDAGTQEDAAMDVGLDLARQPVHTAGYGNGRHEATLIELNGDISWIA